MNLSKMAPIALPLALYTMVANYVTKLSIINASGGGLISNFLFDVPWEKKMGAGFIPGWETIVLPWDFKSFCGLGGP